MKLFSAILAFLAIGLAFPVQAKTIKDLAYGLADAQKLDLYTPESTAKNMPVMIHVHGGGWSVGTKSQVGVKPEAFNAQGMIFISIDYPLIPNVTVREQASSVARAVKWVKTHIKDYGGDQSNIMIMGHSAGGHLVALVGTDERYLKEHGLSFEDIRMVLPLDAGTLDVPANMIADAMIEAAQPRHLIARRLSTMYTDAFGNDPKNWEIYSPIHYLRMGQQYPPFLILTVASRKDSTRQGKEFAGKLNALGGRAEFYPIADRTHRTINKLFGASNDESFEHFLSFLSHTHP